VFSLSIVDWLVLWSSLIRGDFGCDLIGLTSVCFSVFLGVSTLGSGFNFGKESTGVNGNCDAVKDVGVVGTSLEFKQQETFKDHYYNTKSKLDTDIM